MSDALRSALVLGLEIVLLCTAVLVPTALALRHPAPLRGRRAPALALHRAQRDVLDHDRAAGLLQPNEHREAVLEVERRLLVEASLFEPETDAPMRSAPPPLHPALRPVLLLALLAPIPCAALVLYAIGGSPTLPSQPLGNRVEAARTRQQSDDALVDALRAALLKQDPTAPRTRQGYMLLGQTEAARGDWAAAAGAWRTVLAGGFDPVVAVEAAEAQSRAENRVSAESAALFRRALAEGSQDASWRSLAEQRIAQFEHEQDPH